MLEFIGIDGISDELVENSIKFSNIEHMRYIEQHGETNLEIVENDGQATSAQDGVKINEGTTNRYDNYFDEDDRQHFQRVINQQLEDDFGYEYDTFLSHSSVTGTPVSLLDQMYPSSRSRSSVSSSNSVISLVICSFLLRSCFAFVRETAGSPNSTCCCKYRCDDSRILAG